MASCRWTVVVKLSRVMGHSNAFNTGAESCGQVGSSLHSDDVSALVYKANLRDIACGYSNQ